MAICSFCENSCSEIEIQAYGRCSFCQKKYNTIPLSLEDYAKFTDTTAVYPNAGSSDNLELFYLACGLTNEAGEVAGKIKKLFRDGRSSITRDDIASECGDVFWYLCRLCHVLGFNPQTVIDANRQKLLDRKERGKLHGSGDKR